MWTPRRSAIQTHNNSNTMVGEFKINFSSESFYSVDFVYKAFIADSPSKIHPELTVSVVWTQPQHVWNFQKGNQLPGASPSTPIELK